MKNTETLTVWTGEVGDLHVLIEQSPDRTTIATRSHEWESWSAPTDLDPVDVVGFHAAGRAAATVEAIR